MPAPMITREEIARIPRPATRNSPGGETVVEVCTLAPHGAPAHVRPRYVTLGYTRPDGSGVQVAIRRAEIDAVIAALVAAKAKL